MAPLTNQCKHDSPLRCAWRASLAERDPSRLQYSYEASAWLLWLGSVPEIVEQCPGCNGTLPQIGPVVARMEREDWWNTYTGEEGG